MFKYYVLFILYLHGIQFCNSFHGRIDRRGLFTSGNSITDIDEIHGYKKNDIESKKIDIEKRKLHIFFIGIILGIIVFLGFFIIIYIGFEKVAVAIQNVMVIAKSAYEECSKGGWLRLIKSLFHQQI